MILTDKSVFNEKPEITSVSNKNINISNDPDGLENLDEETKNLLSELLNEIDELKKEKFEMSEKALNMLTEKELELMQMKEQMEELKIKSDLFPIEENGNNFREEFSDSSWEKGSIFEKHRLVNSEQKGLFVQFRELKEEYSNYIKETEERERYFLEENADLKRDLAALDMQNKYTINDLEVEISRLKTDINNKDIERIQLESQLNHNDDNNDDLYNEIENYQMQIRLCEEQKEKANIRHKEQFEQLTYEMKELEDNINMIKTQKNEFEQELIILKASFNKNYKEMQEKLKSDLSFKEKELIQLKKRIDTLIREKENLLKDLEINKKSSEKSKNDFNEMTESMIKLRENHEIEMKKWKEKYNILEKKLDNEKNVLIEQNKELNFKYNSVLHELQMAKLENSQVNTTASTFFDEKLRKRSLSDILDPEDVTNKILSLQDEIVNLNGKVFELEDKYSKLNQESDILRKENYKFKNDIKERKTLYENQIFALKSDKLNTASEKIEITANKIITNQRRKSIAQKSPQEIIDFENNINKLNLENKMFNEKIDLLNKEIENIKLSRDKEINSLRTQIKNIDELYADLKVSFATLSFEKDAEIIKLKNNCKKLMNSKGK